MYAASLHARINVHGELPWRLLNAISNVNALPHRRDGATARFHRLPPFRSLWIIWHTRNKHLRCSLLSRLLAKGSFKGVDSRFKGVYLLVVRFRVYLCARFFTGACRFAFEGLNWLEFLRVIWSILLALDAWRIRVIRLILLPLNVWGKNSDLHLGHVALQRTEEKSIWSIYIYELPIDDQESYCTKWYKFSRRKCHDFQLTSTTVRSISFGAQL